MFGGRDDDIRGVFYYEPKTVLNDDQAERLYKLVTDDMNHEPFAGQNLIIDMEEGSDGVWRRKK